MPSIHPYFESLPDRYAAAALSEAFQDGAYKSSSPDQPPGTANVFPPEPASTVHIAAAFLDRDGQTVRQVMPHGIFPPEFQPEDSVTIAAYDRDVESLRPIAKPLESCSALFGLERSHPRYGRLGQWCIEATQRAGKRLLGAHILTVSLDKQRYHSAFMYPVEIYEQFPLLMRNGASSLGTDARDALPEELRPYADDVLHNGPLAHLIGKVPPTTLMPRLAFIKKSVAAHRRPTGRK
jgi:hypothetical protein